MGNGEKKIPNKILELALEESYDGLHILDNNGKTLYINEACARIEGVDIDEVFSKSIKELVEEGVYGCLFRSPNSLLLHLQLPSIWILSESVRRFRNMKVKRTAENLNSTIMMKFASKTGFNQQSCFGKRFRKRRG